MIDAHRNYISGEWVVSSGGETYPEHNPADLSEVIGIYQKSTVEDTRNAISAAGDAFEHWSTLSVDARAEYLKKALALMVERTDSIAKVITLENGKTLAESRVEISAAINEMEFQIHQGLRMPGQMMPSAQQGVLAYQHRYPLGPAAVIAPWNFPFNVPARKITPALISGNTCVLKPAQLTSGAGEEFVKLFHDAGLPAGVLNMVTGSGRVIGDELVTNPIIKAITFTGSTEVGKAINIKAAAGLKRTQLEMGGKNPLVVMDDADIDAAAKSAVIAAFACAGQWCVSTSRALVHKNVMKPFVNRLLELTAEIKVGNGMDTQATMGPVCGEAQLKNILACIEKGKAEGAKLLVGGNQLKTPGLEKGCFIEPTIFADVTPEMFIAQEEIFGPVLGIMEISDLDEAIEISNGSKYGLGASIYTKDIARAMEFTDRIQAGLTHVNMHSAYKEPQLSFGGVKESGHGTPEAGQTGIEFFTEHKTVYINPGAKG